jgi:hypothetical protein
MLEAHITKKQFSHVGFSRFGIERIFWIATLFVVISNIMNLKDMEFWSMK